VNSDFVKPIAQLLDLPLRIPTLILFALCDNFRGLSDSRATNKHIPTYELSWDKFALIGPVLLWLIQC
jgi:uncharacterized membrane protein YvlD (DUF360 family)